MSNESVDFYLSFELFKKPDKITQKGGKKDVKKKTNTKKLSNKKQSLSTKKREDIELSESITSIEYLSDTSESEDSIHLINTIKEQLLSNLENIQD